MQGTLPVASCKTDARSCRTTDGSNSNMRTIGQSAEPSARNSSLIPTFYIDTAENPANLWRGFSLPPSCDKTLQNPDAGRDTYSADRGGNTKGE